MQKIAFSTFLCGPYHIGLLQEIQHTSGNTDFDRMLRTYQIRLCRSSSDESGLAIALAGGGNATCRICTTRFCSHHGRPSISPVDGVSAT